VAASGRRYRIEHTLGKGGFGTVYRAEMLGAEGFRRPVALKVLNADIAGRKEVARRFRDEARLLGILRHRAIVQVDGLVRLRGQWAVVMELVEGVDLSQVLEVSSVPLSCAMEIVREASGALDVAWNAPGPDGRPLHLLHRDIKPSNIQLTAAGEVKLLDFGIARADFDLREAATRSLLFGSEGYMPPERYDHEDAPASDVYSLGVVFYELLTARTFGRTSFRASVHARRLQEVGAELLAVPGVEAEHADFIAAMMAHDPVGRPSARDVESFCWRSLRSLDGPRLREWSEAVVPPLVNARPSVGGPFESGAIVSEASLMLDGETPPPAAEDETAQALTSPNPTQIPLQPGDELAADPPGAETCFFGPEPGVEDAEPEPVEHDADDDDAPLEWTGQPRRPGGLALGALLVVVAGAGLFGVGSFLTAPTPQRPAAAALDRAPDVPTAVAPTETEPEPVDASTPAPTAPAAPAPSDAPVGVVAELVPAVDEPPPAPAARTAAAESSPADAPAEPPPAAPPEPSLPPTGTVQLQGDTDGVLLVGEAGRLPPGALPLGDYSLVLPSPDGDIELGRVHVTPGAPIRVSCSFAFRRCQVM